MENRNQFELPSDLTGLILVDVQVEGYERHCADV
jgi:hypothetical protein